MRCFKSTKGLLKYMCVCVCWGRGAVTIQSVLSFPFLIRLTQHSYYILCLFLIGGCRQSLFLPLPAESRFRQGVSITHVVSSMRHEVWFDSQWEKRKVAVKRVAGRFNSCQSLSSCRGSWCCKEWCKNKRWPNTERKSRHIKSQLINWWQWIAERTNPSLANLNMFHRASVLIHAEEYNAD